MDDVMMEIAKTRAVLNNLLVAVANADDEEVDVYGSLLVIKDQLDKIDNALDDI